MVSAHSRSSRSVVLFIALATATGCSLLYTVDGYDTPTPQDSGAVDSSSDSATDANDGGGTSRDGGSCPDDMVSVGSFCIDRTEVTQSKYAEFLDTVNVAAASAALPPRCGWNTTFAPGLTGDAGGSENSRASNCESGDYYTPLATPNFPVECVDWCDAYAYCAFRGKRLCGAIGGKMGAIGSANDSTKSQWYRACAGEGSQLYPYGSSFSSASCPNDNQVDVGSRSGCVGSVAGLFDLSGNVSEWTDECSGTEASSSCGRRGGAYSDNDVDVACNSNAGGDNDITHMSRRLGFRCCLD